MAIIWIEEVTGPRLELENILVLENKADVARQLAGIRETDELELHRSIRELASDLVAELTDANVCSMLKSYRMASTWFAVNKAGRIR